MLNFITGLEETGLYSLGYKIASTLKFLISSTIMLSLIPLKIEKIGTPNANRFYTKSLTYSSYLFAICLIGLSLFSLEIIKVFTKSIHYWGSVNLIPIISFAFMFGLMKDNVVIGLSIKKKTKIIGLLIFLISMLNILLNALLIPYFDAFGSAIATLISQLVFFILVLNQAQKQYPISYELRKVSKLIILAAIIVVAGVLVTDWVLWLRLLIKAALFVSFPIILACIGFYEPVEIQSIKKILQSWKSPKQLGTNILRLFNN